jgi:hypothetical protein
VGAVEHRVCELAFVVDAGDLEAANADVVRREPEPDAAARSAWSVKNSSSVASAATSRTRRARRSRRQRLAGQLPQVRRAVVHDPGGRELRRADLDADSSRF